MIDVQELRICNLVKIKTSNDAAYYPIYAIDGMGLKVILGGVRQCEGWKYVSLLKPIPLTEELLLKCGFEQSGGLFQKKNSPIYYLDGKFVIAADGYAMAGASIKLKYLHQLQNLDFALTGKELEINL